MTVMTKGETWVLFVLLLLVVTGLIGKAWLAAHPPAPLPPLPAGTASLTR